MMRALCCRGRGGAARGPADRGVFLHRVVVARWSGRRDSVLCRWRARFCFPGLSICLLVVRGVVRSCCGPPMGLLRGWVHGLRKIVTADAGVRP